MKEISRRIVLWLKSKADIKETDTTIYEYGMEILLHTVFSTIIYILVGIVFKEFVPTVLFLIVFCGCQTFGGGYHASTHFKCILVTTGYVVFSCITLKILPESAYPWSILAILFSGLPLWLVPVVLHRNKEYLKTDLQQKRKVSRIITGLFIIFNSLLFFLAKNGIVPWHYTIAAILGLVTASISRIIALFIQLRNSN